MGDSPIEQVFNGSTLHAYILQYLQPIVWVTVCARVSKRWRRLCYRPVLWAPILELVYKEVPILRERHIDGYPHGWRGWEWYRSLIQPFKGRFTIREAQQVAAMHVHPVMRERRAIWIDEDLLVRPTAEYDNGKSHQLYRQDQGFILPLYDLILYGSYTFRATSALAATSFHNGLFIKMLAVQRKRI